ncbi:hypothetical protein [Chryseobacterium sp.]|uniref:hypothetical protein n=1 Tax=Chryseobacterium sp. TaxID=1871047 RepID=UPI000EC7D66D|nr:hypothetical protein [Chryseobacterium sp.]HCA06656.1 hypothetical protein [Chryseobacterium sp.]
MFHKAIIFSLGMLTLAGCNAQKKAKTPDSAANTSGTKSSVPKEGVIYLNQGENKFLKEYDMNVTFKGISEDSRCPEGVNCIWAGVAVAQIEVMGTYTRPTVLLLASSDNAGRNYYMSQEFNGYTISMKEITPFPKSDGGVKALEGKYKVAFTIKKTEGAANVDTTRK